MSDLERDPSDPWTAAFEAQCREAVARGERLADEHLRLYTQKDVAAERERCAKIAETTGYGYGDSPENAPPYSAHGLARRIRSGE